MKLEKIMERWCKESDVRSEHKAKLEQKHGLTGHPKADRLYRIAWDAGHAEGYHEIEMWYEDLAELLQP